jgi:rfaE bifunctional protein nucleotidyltransferase chain/domain
MDTLSRKYECDTVRGLELALAFRKRCREERRRVVFTNGCFDLMHIGHVRYLNQAREFGDCLIVAVNSDRSVREIKGSGRPLFPEAERAEVIAALACVSYVFVFDERTPQRVIDAIVPDVLVKGADWGPGEIVGRETVERAGGTVCSVPLVEGVSTTAIIAAIRERFGGRGPR